MKMCENVQSIQIDALTLLLGGASSKCQRSILQLDRLQLLLRTD